MFNKEHAYHHLTSLAYPRGIGSFGEKRSHSYINQSLEQLGITVDNQVFTFSKITDYLLRILPFLGGVCLWLFTVVFPAQSWNAFYLLSGSIMLVLSSSFFSIPFGKLHKFNTTLKSANIIGHIPSLSEPTHQIVFVAHYDSKSQTLPIAIRALCFFILVLSLFLIMCSHVLSFYFYRYPFTMVNLISGYVSLLSGLLLFFNITRNSSPGAADNASGVSIVLELARVFSKMPLLHTQVTVLFTSAEEYGMAGAFYYMENNPDLKLQVSFINIDGVGDSAPVGIVRAKKTFISSIGKKLYDEIIKTAHSLSLPCVPLKTLIGIGFDHIPIALCGFSVVTLCSYSPKMVLRIHSKRDTRDHVCVHSMDTIGRLCEKYTRDCDSQKQ